MFILRHHLPAKYRALHPLPLGTKHPDTIAREEAWAKAGDLPRPALRRPRTQWPFEGAAQGCKERVAAPRAAEARIAEAQADWEAASTEAGWATWCAKR